MENKNFSEKNFDELFWADQLTNKVINKKKYRYLDKEIKKPKEFVVKTAASLSGVLHIGRLSDTIRSATVHRAILDAGEKSKLIWVSDDMDPLRKIPQGVPSDFEKYIGSPVSMITDHEKCHNTYAEHHLEEYLKVIRKFIFEDIEIFSMADEYKKGNFRLYIKKLIENADTVREIQNKHRTNPLKKHWNPWNPLCENCNKIITTKITGFDEEKGTVFYVCNDYEFETTTAKGCGYKGENNPLKDLGKLAYKSESAAQWARWNVSCEGWGKEYQVPNSAFWINTEICENVLDFPAPEPFFYEHLLIDNQKMSASIGNVIYPKDWLEAAPSELLRLFYNKRLMTTRSFSWKDLPNLYDEYDKISKVYFDELKLENKKEELHLKRLFEVSHGKDIKKPVELSFSHAAVIAQIF
ncbi:lysine--tRNA ligase, partial [Candidatus Woesearchaeota archaeon]|nr:lysine--tRNA ligase [Candidatus Woesearchaeota archaeon]